jgi:hypothetical protein
MTYSASILSAGSRLLCALVLLVLGPGAVFACMPPGPGVTDLPITLYSDGSFVNAETNKDMSSFEGRPARDIGGGRVGQVFQYRACEPSAQWLLFVDCTTGSAVMVAGITGPIAEEDRVYMSTRALQAPYGPLALTPSTTVAEVASVAAREGWTVRTDVPAYAAERGPQNAFNPFFGCRIFYPGSVGAGR